MARRVTNRNLKSQSTSMELDEKQFRNALGRFATGVCVVSAINQSGAIIGMTINSFSSISLTPSLVQWSIKNRAACYSLFADLAAYSISFLSQKQLDISNRYARAGNHLMHHGDYLLSSNGIPFVKDSLAHFECRGWRTYQAGDHDIIVAIVSDFSNHTHEEPLVFYKGAYRSLIADSGGGVSDR